MAERITTGTILARAGALLAANPRPALIWFGVLAGLGVAADLIAGPDARGFDSLLSILGLFAQFGVTQIVLRRVGLLAADRQPGRAAAFVIAILLCELGIALGLVLLIVPGFYLLARWSLVTPAIIGENAGIFESMRISAARTRGHIPAIIGVWLAIFILVVAPIVMSVAIDVYGLPGEQLTMLIAADVLTPIGMILAWYCCIAVYALTSPRSGS